MSPVILKFQLSRSADSADANELLAAIKASDPDVVSLQLTPVNSMGMSKKEIVISIAIAFGSAVAANNVADAGKVISSYFQKIGIQATQMGGTQTPSSGGASVPLPDGQ